MQKIVGKPSTPHKISPYKDRFFSNSRNGEDVKTTMVVMVTL